MGREHFMSAREAHEGGSRATKPNQGQSNNTETTKVRQGNTFRKVTNQTITRRNKLSQELGYSMQVSTTIRMDIVDVKRMMDRTGTTNYHAAAMHVIRRFLNEG